MSDATPDKLRHVPLEQRHEALGGKMVPFAGFLMPVRYSGIKDEHHAVRTNVGLFDVSHMGEIEIRGPQAIRVIDGLVTNDASTLVDGQAMYSAMCNAEGGIVDDLVFYRLADDHVLAVVNAANIDKDFAHMVEHASGDAELTNTSEQWGQLAVQGPRAEALVAELTDADLSTIKYYRAAFGEVAGVRTLISRTGYTGEDGFELYVAAGEVETVFDALVDAGQDYDLQLCGLGARDTLRLEAKFNLYGQDMDESTNPLEAGMGWVVKLDKATPFVGQEALRRIKEEGVSRRLRGLVLEGRGVIRHGYELFLGDEKVGYVTSGSYAPTLEESIGLGYIDVAHAGADTVEVDIRGRRIPAAVTKKPFYRREK